MLSVTGQSARAPVLLFRKTSGKNPMDQRKSPADCERRSNARNSASREDSDHKSRVEGRSWANKLHCLGISFFNIQNERGKSHWPVSGYLKKPLQHQTYRHYSPVFCFVFHRTSCLWPVVSFLLAFGNRSYYMIIIIDFVIL